MCCGRRNLSIVVKWNKTELDRKPKRKESSIVDLVSFQFMVHFLWKQRDSSKVPGTGAGRTPNSETEEER